MPVKTRLLKCRIERLFGNNRVVSVKQFDETPVYGYVSSEDLFLSIDDPRFSLVKVGVLKEEKNKARIHCPFKCISIDECPGDEFLVNKDLLV